MTFLSPTKIVASYNLQDPIGQADSEIFAVLGSTIEVIGEPGVVPINTVYGDDLANYIAGGSGSDGFLGMGGNDTLLGNGGNDILYAGSGDDLLEGGEGNDELFVFGGNDSIFGGAGDDYVNGFGGTNYSLYGGSGYDFVSINLYQQSAAQVIVFQLGGNITMTDGTIIDGFEAMYLGSGTGNDELIFNSPIGYFDFRNGWFGGAGYDHANLNFSNHTENLYVGIGPALDNSGVKIAADYIFTLSSVEVITFISGSGDDTLLGGTGGDYLVGNAGNDELYGDSGDDFLSGGDGDDYLVVQGGNDSIYGDSGNDTVEVYYLFGVSSGPSGLYGGDGTDIIQIDVAQNSSAQNIDFRPNGMFDLSNGSHFSEFEVIRLNTGSGDDYLRISLENNYYNTWNATTGNDHVTLDCTSQTESITARLGNAGEWGTVATPDWILCELFDV